MSFLISSITPVIIFLFLIYNKDSIKEPWGLLMKCFFGGFLSIIITLLIDGFLEPFGKGFTSPFASSFFDAFFQAGFPEELSKLIILYWFVWKRKEFDQHFDGIIYAVFVSMGFALVENLMYVYKGGISVAMMRAVLAVPGHGFFAVAMGYYFSLAKFHNGPKKNEFLLKSLLVPAIMHGAYDFALIYASKSEENPLLILLLLVIFTVIVIRIWRRGLKKISLHYQKDIAVVVNEAKAE
jgi:RsiW-degrading membrane proteinase PrsW (M82 family)